MRDLVILFVHVIATLARLLDPGGNRAGTHVLMTGYAGDNSIDPERAALGNNGVTNPIAGWWNEVGGGRMFYVSPGYTAAVVNHPTMQRVYANAVRWVLAKLL